jgi:hypothetical protein
MDILGIVGGLGIMVILGIILLLLLLPLIALIDILRSEFNGSDKIVWVLVVLFLPLLGSVLYFLIGSSRKIRN